MEAKQPAGAPSGSTLRLKPPEKNGEFCLPQGERLKFSLTLCGGSGKGFASGSNIQALPAVLGRRL